MSGARGLSAPRRLALALAAIPLLAIGIADLAIYSRLSDEPARPHAGASPTPSVEHREASAADEALKRAQAVRDLLARRSAAVLHHDRRAWLRTVDPRRRHFRARQAQVFANFADVPFASWSYSFDPAHSEPLDAQARRRGTDAWAPAHFQLHYRLRGFDRRPTSLDQYPTFVRRGHRWYLASLSDFAAKGQKSSADIWDYGPVDVVRRPHVLVLGHPASLATMDVVATEAAADIPRVSAVWGHDWSEQAVVLVPDTQHELSRVVDDAGDLDNIAAVATAEVTMGARRPNPVGNRIGINPANWPKISPLGRRIVLTHELTHVATRAITTAATPSWLAEGFADYVGYLGSGIPTAFVAQDLAADVRRGKVPRRLPADAQFNGASPRLSQAYEGAWMACRLIADRWGQQTLVRFYRAVGRLPGPAKTAVATAMPRVLHVSPARFERDWRADLRAELG